MPSVRVPGRLTPLLGLQLGGSGGPAWTNRGVDDNVAYSAPVVLGVWDCEADRPHDDPETVERLSPQPVQHGDPLLRVRLPFVSAVGAGILPPGMAAVLFVGGLDGFERNILGAVNTWSKGGSSGMVPVPTAAELGIGDTSRQWQRLALWRSCKPALNILPYAHRGDAVFNLRTLAGGARYVCAYMRLIEPGPQPFPGTCLLQYQVLGGYHDAAEPWRRVWHGVSYGRQHTVGFSSPPADYGLGADWADGEALFPLCAGTAHFSAQSLCSFATGWVQVTHQLGGTLADRRLIQVPPAVVEGLRDSMPCAGELRITVARDVSSITAFAALLHCTVTP